MGIFKKLWAWIVAFWKRITGKKPPVAPDPPRGPITIKLRPPAHKDICPFCMERFNVWDLEFRSISVDEGDEEKGYPREVDEKYVKFWKDVQQPTQQEEQNFVLNIADKENVTAVQLWDDDVWIPNTSENETVIEKKAIRRVRDKYGNVAIQRICPHCHNNLPFSIGRSPNYIISMMGNTMSGKSVYLSRLLLSLLENGFLPSWGLTVNLAQADPENPVSLAQFKAGLRKMFSSEKSDDKSSGKLAEATTINYMHPTILELQKGHERILLTLFDFPGEAIWKLNGNERPYFQQLMHRMNENADGWLFLFDSTTLKLIRNCILSNHDEEYLPKGDINDPDFSAEPEDILKQFSNFFGAGNQIKPPVAFVFSKSDMIARYAEQLNLAGYQIDPDSPFLRHAPHSDRSKVDLDDLMECHQAIQKFLHGNQVLTTANNLCRQYAWFASSATGVPVKDGQMGNTLSSARRVVEPLEWLLWMLGAYAGEYTYGNPLWNALAARDSDKG